MYSSSHGSESSYSSRDGSVDNNSVENNSEESSKDGSWGGSRYEDVS